MMTDGTTPLAELLGNDLVVPVWGGGTRRYINLDNAATTPCLLPVWEKLRAVMPWYGSVHRGAGYKSMLSTQLVESSSLKVLRFGGGSESDDIVLFGSNTTACINLLARRLARDGPITVITSDFEHSSNLLPWRKHASVLTCRTDDSGEWDLDDLERLLAQKSVDIVAVTGASNVTGIVLDTATIASRAHHYGARVFVDASQFVAHRELKRCSPDDPTYLDFVVFAGHKMYAPFGVGALIGPRAVFEQGWPDQPGGGTVRMIDGEEVVWASLPERELGGTPNFPGIIALAEACTALEGIGFSTIAAHERHLIAHAREIFGGLSNVVVYCPLDPNDSKHLAIFPFSVQGHHHSLVAAYLGAERAVGVRSGHLCQYELIRRMLKIPNDERRTVLSEVQEGNARGMYGVVRASSGIATTLADLDVLAEALEEFVSNGPKASYEQDSTGEFRIPGWTVPLTPPMC